MNKREKIALYLFIFGVIWYFAENTYFGWHMKPINAWEGIADFMIWVFWGLGFFIKPSRVEHKTIVNNVDKAEFDIKKSKVNFIDKTKEEITNLKLGSQ